MDTILTLKRQWYTDKSTIGELFIGFDRECFTLEDTVRAVKVQGETAIPAGRYEVIINYSNRFQKYLPMLLDVPGFEGIRIHSGNDPADTHGCILVGKGRPEDQENIITDSRAALKDLMFKLDARSKTGKIFIEIIGGKKIENDIEGAMT
jgi:hypothetical protein